MRDKRGCSLCVLFTFLFGALIGILAGVLIAPESGLESRTKIKYKTKDLFSDFKFSMDRLLNYIKSLNLRHDQCKEGEEMVQEAIDKADQIMEEI